ncbi:MAG: carbohydrate ABC transporter permease [Anaerolineae bacterium]
MWRKETTLIDKVISYSLLVFLGALLASPFSFMISVALTSDETAVKMDFSFIPEEFHIENFVRVFGPPHELGRYFKNSLILCFFAVIGQVFASSLVAYGFARLRAPGKDILFVILLSTMMIPGEVTMIPQFDIFRRLQWINTLLPLIVPNFFGGAYNIFLMRQFISRVPRDLDEAAQIDGLSFMGIYRQIILPLIKPVLVTVAIMTFSWNWGWFMGPLIYINDTEKMPLALGVQILSAVPGGQLPKYNIVMVGALILVLPMVLLYFFGQKYMYQVGIVSSGGSTLK